MLSVGIVIGLDMVDDLLLLVADFRTGSVLVQPWAWRSARLGCRLFTSRVLWRAQGRWRLRLGSGTWWHRVGLRTLQ